MGFFDADIARDLLGLAFGVTTFTPPGVFYVGLLDEGEREFEPSFAETASYVRKIMATSDWALASGVVDDKPGVGVQNAVPVLWNALGSGESWRVRFVRIYSDASSDARIATLDLGKTLVFREGNTPYLPTGKLKLLAEYFE